MAHVYADRVRDTTTTTGTGAVTLSGTAPTGFQTFLAAVGNGNTVYYTINSLVASEWETGFGTLSGGTTLTRTQVIASSNAGAVVNFSAGAKEVFGTAPAAFFQQTLGRTNLTINPHGSIQQETTTPISGTASSAYFADQWNVNSSGTTFVIQAGVATGGGVSEFDPSYIFVKTTTIKSSLAAADVVNVEQPYEGLRVRRLLYGGATARGSWVRFRASATAPGTASFYVQNSARNRSFVQSFPVTTTPTLIAIFVPGDTTGTWPADNTRAAITGWCFASGATAQTATLGAWQAGNFNAATTQSNMLDTLNRQLNISDVMWSPSVVLLPFEPIDWDQELRKCQRYWEKSFSYATAPVQNAGLATGEHRWQTIVAGAATLRATVRFTVGKRSNGYNVTLYNPAAANSQIRDISSALDATGSVAQNKAEDAFEISGTANGSSLAANGMGVHWVAENRL